MNVFDYIRASEIIAYYEETIKAAPLNYVGEALFPNKKQESLKAAYLTGEASYPRLLTPSAYDADPTLRPRRLPEVHEEEILFFREAMTLTEEDRRGLMQVEATGNTALIESYAARIVNDRAELINGARARNEVMRMEILSTGKLDINDNGIIRTLDYGIGETQKANAAVSWENAETATPLTDLQGMALKGMRRGLLTEGTLNQLMTSKQVRNYLVPQGVDPGMALVSRNQVLDLVEQLTNIQLAVVNQYYELKDGTEKQMFPDGVISLFPAVGKLGDTRFAPTPEEYDYIMKNELPSNDIEVALYNNVITMLSEYLNKVPVQIRTSVSMNSLPTLDVAKNLHIFSTTASI